MKIKELLLFCVNHKASDLHLSSGEPPIMRVNGDINKIDLPILSKTVAKEMIYEIMNDSNRISFEENMEVDFAFELNDIARFRVNVFMQARGIAAVFRLIPAKIISLNDLEAPEIFKQIAVYKNGLVLVTGITGSGKSTTIASIIDFINENYSQHILTIEDPIEFVHLSKKSLVNQRELNTNTYSFTNALKSALREDPDTILIGELRDLETIRLALTAAETGHLVFATLHTSSAAKTIDRVIDVFPAAEKDMVRVMLSESLRAVISQRLVKSKDNMGRIACHEIMIVNSAIKNLIRENK
ncbi:MAG: type IV pilus twitching motility protein PilT, partial [Burkholderiales bacterium]|nr:type IV pilus twitching motility protein PilT [Burkholderiales bacterium]